eukprot:3496808-Amphidinium_carterae.1
MGQSAGKCCESQSAQDQDNNVHIIFSVRVYGVVAQLCWSSECLLSSECRAGSEGGNCDKNQGAAAAAAATFTSHMYS